MSTLSVIDLLLVENNNTMKDLKKHYGGNKITVKKDSKETETNDEGLLLPNTIYTIYKDDKIINRCKITYD
jgi:hypothetical protein